MVPGTDAVMDQLLVEARKNSWTKANQGAFFTAGGWWTPDGGSQYYYYFRAECGDIKDVEVLLNPVGAITGEIGANSPASRYVIDG